MQVFDRFIELTALLTTGVFVGLVWFVAFGLI